MWQNLSHRPWVLHPGPMAFMRAAVRDYTEAIDIDPSSARSYYNRAIAKMALYQSEEALKDLEIASRLGFEAADKVIADYFKN